MKLRYVFLGCALCLTAISGQAQFMPMEESRPATAAPPVVVEVKATPGVVDSKIERMVMKVTPEPAHALIDRVWDRFLAPGSPYRPLILTVLTLLFLIQVKRMSTRAMKGFLEENAFDPDNVTGFLEG